MRFTQFFLSLLCGCSLTPGTQIETPTAESISEAHGMTASASCMAQPLAERKLRLLCLHGYMQNAEVYTRCPHFLLL